MSREYIARYTKKDFRIETFASGGPGGQHQNKTQSGVRITHIPSGLSVERRVYKSQKQNKKEAFHVLGELVLRWHKRLELEKNQYTKSSEVVRTYNVPDNRVTDTISGEQQAWKSVAHDVTDMIEIRRNAINHD
jgi:protein subunit release factor A